jgi:hypothetical protein
VRRQIILGIAAIGLVYFYLVALVYASGVMAAQPVPAWWLGIFSARRGAILPWLLISHLVVVLLVSLAFAWVIVHFYGRFSIRVSIAISLVIWGVVEAPLGIDAFRSDGFFSKGIWLADTVQYVGALPALVLLLRSLPSNNRLERSRAASPVDEGEDR